MKKINVMALVFCLILATGSAFADTLVVNGGFETGDFTGWNLTGNQDGNTIVVGAWGPIAPNSGSYQAVFGACDATCTGLDPGGISQTLATIASNTYDVSFWLANDSGPPNEISVTLGGVTLLSLDTQGYYGWTFYHFTGLSVGDNASLEISASNIPGYFHLDDVAVSTETPEPASLALLGSGLLGLAGATKRKFFIR